MKKALLNSLLLGLCILCSHSVLAQTPEISNLSLSSSSGQDRTIDNLSATYTNGTSVVETASVWYRNGTSENLLYLPFEGGSANALLDFSGLGHDARHSTDPTENPTWEVNGGHNGNGAFSFDGNDYLIADNVIPTNTSYTKSAWINLAGTDFRNIMSSALNDDNNHHFKVDPDGTMNAGHSFGFPVVEDPTPLPDAHWYFVAVTFHYPSGEMVLYRDGVEVDRDFVPEALRSVLDPTVLIGAKAYSFEWEGSIDEPRVFNRALSPEQILALYNSGNDFMAAQETRGSDQWQVRVTPFSETAVGATYFSGLITLQPLLVSSLTLAASSTGNYTIDDLTATYSTNSSVLETASTWYRNNSPDALLYLPFEGGTHNALRDFSGSDNDASRSDNISALPAWDQTSGVDGSAAYVFDGDDYLIGGDIFPLSSSYTKSAWVNIAGSGFRNIMSSVLHDRNNHYLKVDSDGTLNAGHNNGEYRVRDPQALVAGQWYFVAVTFDYATGEMILYKDGNVVDVETVAADLRDVIDPSLLIGAMNYLFRWEGAIDEPRLYDRVLSPEQIQSLYDDRGDVTVSQETSGADEWYVQVTPFSLREAGSTRTSNVLAINSLVATSIPDQTIQEGSAFSIIDLNSYVSDYEFTDSEQSWTSAGNSDLGIAIDPTTHMVTVSIPDADWYGSEDVTFTVENPNGEDASMEVTLTVQNVNDAPVITELGDQDVDEDNDLTGLAVTFADPDGVDSHSITVVSDNGSVSVESLSGNTSGSTYNLVPDAEWSGTANITVTVTDNGTGTLSDIETYMLTVNPINDVPVLTVIGDQDVDEDLTLAGLAVNFTDADAGDAHTISVVSGESNVTVENLSGHTSGSTYELVPAADWSGTAQITVTVTDDGTGTLSDSEVYTLTVNSVNDAPVITEIGDQSTDEDVNLTGLAVTFSDGDADDTHSVTVVSDNSSVTVANLSGTTSGSTYDLELPANWSGTAQITVTVTDDGDGALFDSESYMLTVDPVNDAPSSINLSNNSTDENVPVGTVIGILSSVDPDTDDDHQYTFIEGDGFMSADNDAFIIAGDTLITNAEINYEDKDGLWITVQSDDGNGGLGSESFRIGVMDVLETGLSEFDTDLSFNVYPVPAIDYVTVEVDNPENKEMLLEIYSNTGRLIHAEAIFHKNTVDLNGFSDGMYILQIKGERVFGTRKIIVKDR